VRLSYFGGLLGSCTSCLVGREGMEGSPLMCHVGETRSCAACVQLVHCVPSMIPSLQHQHARCIWRMLLGSASTACAPQVNLHRLVWNKFACCLHSTSSWRHSTGADAFSALA
jgi:hypothetical protein